MLALLDGPRADSDDAEDDDDGSIWLCDRLGSAERVRALVLGVVETELDDDDAEEGAFRPEV